MNRKIKYPIYGVVICFVCVITVSSSHTQTYDIYEEYTNRTIDLAVTQGICEHKDKCGNYKLTSLMKSNLATKLSYFDTQCKFKSKRPTKEGEFLDCGLSFLERFSQLEFGLGKKEQFSRFINCEVCTEVLHESCTAFRLEVDTDSVETDTATTTEAHIDTNSEPQKEEQPFLCNCNSFVGASHRRLERIEETLASIKRCSCRDIEADTEEGEKQPMLDTDTTHRYSGNDCSSVWETMEYCSQKYGNGKHCSIAQEQHNFPWLVCCTTEDERFCQKHGQSEQQKKEIRRKLEKCYNSPNAFLPAKEKSEEGKNCTTDMNARKKYKKPFLVCEGDVFIPEASGCGLEIKKDFSQ